MFLQKRYYCDPVATRVSARLPDQRDVEKYPSTSDHHCLIASLYKRIYQYNKGINQIYIKWPGILYLLLTNFILQRHQKYYISHCMVENAAFHGFLWWKMIIVLTNYHCITYIFIYQRLRECTFELGSGSVKRMITGHGCRQNLDPPSGPPFWTPFWTPQETK